MKRPNLHRPKRERREGNALREQLRAEQGNRCHWCAAEMCDAEFGHPRSSHSVTLDHIVQRNCGGDLSRENCVAACYECNDRRSREFTQARAPLASKIAKAVNGLNAAEIEERLGRVARELSA